MDTQKRYNVIPEIDHLTFNLNQARIANTRATLNGESYNELPSSESPFHPELFGDVQYYEPRLQERRRVLTKYENKDNRTMDIALYNTRTHSLNAEDVPGLENLKLHKDQMERARSKIKQRWMDYVPHETSNPNTSNGDQFNPMLPISDTNKPHSTYSPGFVDELLGWFTNGREFKYASDISNDAYNLQRSPEILERNRRQAEADDALYHRHQKSRWVEPKQAYRVRSYDPNYDIDTFTKHDASKANDRNQGNTQKENFNTVIKSKPLVNVETVNKIKPDVEQSFNALYKPRMYMNTLTNYKDRSDPISKKSNVINEAFTPTSTKSGFFTTLASSMYSSVVESIKSLLSLSSSNPQHSLINKRTEYQEQPHRLQYSFIDSPHFIDQLFRDIKEQYKEPFQHVLIKRGQDGIPAVYEDKDFSNTAPMFITKDPWGEGTVRTMALIDNGHLKLVQKWKEDTIFMGDGRPIGADYIVYDIPVDSLPTPIREKLVNNKNSRWADLTIHEHELLVNTLIQNVSAADRLKFEDIWKKIRGNKFDEDMLTNFDSRAKFVAEGAIQSALAELRKLQVRDENRARIDKEQYATSEQEYLDIHSPMPSSSIGYRPVQVNDTPYATTRTSGANLRQFNA